MALTFPEDIIVVCDWIVHAVDPDEAVLRSSFPSEREDILAATLENALQTAAPLHRRQALLKIGGFRENLVCCQEKDLHLRLVAAGHRFCRIPIDGVVVRRTTGSVSADNLKVLRQHYDVYRNLAQILTDTASDGQWQCTLAAALNRDAFDLSGALLSAEAKPFLSLAKTLDPKSAGLAGLAAPLPRTLARLFGPSSGAQLYSWLKRGQKILRNPIGRPTA